VKVFDGTAIKRRHDRRCVSRRQRTFTRPNNVGRGRDDTLFAMAELSTKVY